MAGKIGNGKRKEKKKRRKLLTPHNGDEHVELN